LHGWLQAASSASQRVQWPNCWRLICWMANRAVDPLATEDRPFFASESEGGKRSNGNTTRLLAEEKYNKGRRQNGQGSKGVMIDPLPLQSSPGLVLMGHRTGPNADRSDAAPPSAIFKKFWVFYCKLQQAFLASKKLFLYYKKQTCPEKANCFENNF